MTKLWIIEDNVAYRRGIERALRGMDGIDDVRTFVSCEEAFAALAEGATPDVVLLDVGLPVVLMTALPPGDARRAGLNCPVLTKPFDETELAVALAGFDD